MKNNQEQRLSDFNLVKYGYPDDKGHYGVFGGTFVAETLIEPLTNLRNMYHDHNTIRPCASGELCRAPYLLTNSSLVHSCEVCQK